MRLLHTNSLELRDFIGSDTPPYAILSHRWEDGEVTYQDMQRGVHIGMEGYNKIRSCCAQALSDGFEYVWIDTCCIDKSSSAELSEAINSMFQYYKRSAVCYAYLSDVHIETHYTKSHVRTLRQLSSFAGAVGDPILSRQDGIRWIDESSETSRIFKASMWFTRGWTLQELIAPTKVWFYGQADGEWYPIGEKSDLTDYIVECTGIDPDTLRGRELRLSSVAARMSWASTRKTTREEDIAYCLLGIFDVNMPLLYGEGKKSFLRLQEEIMKSSDDQTLFLWNADVAPTKTLLSGLLASTPLQFQDSGTFFPTADVEMLSEFSMTNRGLRIELPVIDRNADNPGKDCLAVFQCQDSRAFGDLVGIHLTRTTKQKGVQYARDARQNGGLVAVPPHRLSEASFKSIYIKQEPDDPEATGSVTIHIRSNSRYELIAVDPPVQPQSANRTGQIQLQTPPRSQRGALLFSNDVFFFPASLPCIQSYIIVLFANFTYSRSSRMCKVIHFLSTGAGLPVGTNSRLPICTEYNPFDAELTNRVWPPMLHPREEMLVDDLLRGLGEGARSDDYQFCYYFEDLVHLDSLFVRFGEDSSDNSFSHLPNGFTVSAAIRAGSQRGVSMSILDVNIHETTGKDLGPFELADTEAEKKVKPVLIGDTLKNIGDRLLFRKKDDR